MYIERNLSYTNPSMKKGLLLILSLLLPTLVMAGTVGKDAAMKKARSFMDSRNGAKTRSVQAELQLAAAQEGYYIFNVSRQGGFVIVSSDDCAPDILGYADSGTIDPDNMPDNMKAWLQGYADQISWMKANGAKPWQQTMTRGGARNAISPLLTSHWTQNAPYNNQTPTYVITYTDNTTETKHYVTGCVATAVGQIMYYSKWPTGNTKAIPEYKPDNSGGTSFPTLPALGATMFDWLKMGDRMTDSDDGAKEVAKLMKYIGTAVQMNYAKDGSGANDGVAIKAMKNYFGYTNATYLERNKFSYSEWIDIIYSELSAGRPVLYGGQSTGGGHAFVCDGYAEDDLFHINWGWNNGQDGYFRLSALKPEDEGIGGSTTGDGYRMMQDIGVGLANPDFTASYPSGEFTNPTLTVVSVTPTNLTANQANDITITIQNESTTEVFHDNITVALMKNKDDILQNLAGTTVDIEPGKIKDITLSVTPTYFGTSIPLAVFNGYFGGTKLKTVNVTIAEGSGSGTPTETSNDVELTFSVKVINLSSDGKYILGDKAKLAITATNNDNKNYSGYIGYYLDWSMSGYNGTGSGYVSTTVAANSSKTVEKELDFKQFVQNLIAKGLPATSDYTTGSYTFQASYNKAGSFTQNEASKTDTYGCKPGLTYYNAAGELMYDIATATYTAPTDAKLVDLRGQTTVNSITPSQNPNCLYLLDESATAPSGLTTNIVKGTSSASITLQDGYDLFAPFDITASQISYTRKITTPYTVTSGKSKGWTTICLPFDVTTIKADGTAIDWFKNSSDKGKDFWLAEFKSDDASRVTFDYASEMKAYTPYIIAVPGDQWGREYDLTGKTLTFSGTNATIKSAPKATVSGSNFKFSGALNKQSLTDVYALNAEGNKFENGNSTVDAFRAYFAPGTISYAPKSFDIVFGDGGATGISTVTSQTEIPAIVYDLTGKKVGIATEIDQLPRGIYIVNGKKIIK